MALVRVKETQYGNTVKSIVKFPDHYVNTTAKIAATAAETVDGKKIIRAGTPVTLLNGVAAKCTTKGQFDGVVFNTEEVAEGETLVNITVLIHGFVRKNALTDNTATSKNPMIVVLP